MIPFLGWAPPPPPVDHSTLVADNVAFHGLFVDTDAICIPEAIGILSIPNVTNVDRGEITSPVTWIQTASDQLDAYATARWVTRGIRVRIASWQVGSARLDPADSETLEDIDD